MCDVYRHNNLGAVFQPKVYSRIIKRRVRAGRIWIEKRITEASDTIGKVSLDGEDPECHIKKFHIHSVGNRETILNKGTELNKGF